MSKKSSVLTYHRRIGTKCALYEMHVSFWRRIIESAVTCPGDFGAMSAWSWRTLRIDLHVTRSTTPARGEGRRQHIAKSRYVTHRMDRKLALIIHLKTSTKRAISMDRKAG